MAFFKSNQKEFFSLDFSVQQQVTAQKKLHCLRPTITYITNGVYIFLIIEFLIFIIQSTFFPFGTLSYEKAVELSESYLILLGFNCGLAIIASTIVFTIQSSSIFSETDLVNIITLKINYKKSLSFYGFVLLSLFNVLIGLVWFDSYAKFEKEFGEIPNLIFVILCIFICVTIQRMYVLFKTFAKHEEESR